MSLPRMASSLAQSWERFREYHRTVAELSALDDRALADLDIGRHEIRRVAREAIN
ncbi:MAG: DUF1127 domain-containing protein [Ancalomicrobiaceae bacterium]|nr:DUF1127 domain-containing protein [Ancalomicrobiaceae bacterium]